MVDQGLVRKRPILSVVFLTWNTLIWSRRAFQRVMAELSTMEESWEFIWVDQGSTDGTQDYAKALPGITRRVFYQNGSGLPRATSIGRNLGIASASGEFVMLLDGDITPPLGWIRLALNWLQDRPDFWGITIFPGLCTHLEENATRELRELKEVRESCSSMTNLGIYRAGYFEDNPFPTHGVWGEWGWGFEDTWQSTRGRKLGRKTACVFDEEIAYLHPINSSCGLLDRVVGQDARKERMLERKRLLHEHFSTHPVG